jgi:three-Cys-motif partner protein
VTETFFDESREQSQVKSTIVQKYFWAWAKIITRKMRGDRIAYIDLFAGPGRYKDGTVSTPLLILEQAITDPDMRGMLVTMFNDVDANNSKSLEMAIRSLPGIETLKHEPKVYNNEVGTQIVERFEKMHLVPTLMFVDPWGYKGLSLRLVNSVLKDWACECIFFFNYNRINAGLGNSKVAVHMEALFGRERAEALRARLEGMTPGDRELTVVEELAEALKDMGGRFVLPFTFKNDAGTRTSHHLIFVSKHALGYDIMKGIMAGESSRADQGVASFQYSPADARFPLLFALSRPLDDLAGDLVDRFAGRRLTVKQIYEEHNVGTPYILSNYKTALTKLEVSGQIRCEPAERRVRNGEKTMADHVVVSFPKRKK